MIAKGGRFAERILLPERQYFLEMLDNGSSVGGVDVQDGQA